MEFDPVRNEFVLFGGETSGFLHDEGGGDWNNETWAYNGTTWTRKTPATNPPAIVSPTMVFDPIRQNMVLFGNGRIWTWNGTNWTEAAFSRTEFPAEAYFDPIRGGVVVHRFTSLQGNGPFVFGSTTSGGLFWNGNFWTNDVVTGAAGLYSAVAFDAARQRAVAFGGLGQFFRPSADTVTNDGVASVWQAASPATRPPARYGHRMVYDPGTSRVFLYGGLPLTNDLWSWDGTDWSRVAVTNAPTARSGSGFAINPANRLVVMFGGRDENGALRSETWHLTVPASAGVTTGNSPGQCGATVTYSTPAINGSTSGVTCSPGSGSTFPIGTTTVNCNSSGGSGSFLVRVNDTEAPRINVPPTQFATAPGPTAVSYSASATDNCPGVQLTTSPASGSTFPAGASTVTFTATDSAGNTATANTTILVPARYTIVSNPPGLPVSIDGQMTATPAIRDWIPNSNHTLGGGGTQGRTRFIAPTQSIAAPASATTLTVTFASQHQLTATAIPSAGGNVTVTPASPDGFYDAGASVQLQVAAGGSFQFTGWSGALAGTASPVTLTLDGPKDVQAEFAPLSSCRFELSQDTVAILPTGDLTRVLMRTAPGCAWSATTTTPWINIHTAAGSGPGPVRFTVTPNGTASARTGRVRIAGTDVTVLQSSAGCTFGLTPPSQIVSHLPSLQSVAVQTPAACQWTAIPTAPWLRLNPSAQSGPATLGYNVSDNFEPAPRVAAINAGGQMMPVLQKPRELPQWFTDVPPTSPFFDFVALAVTQRLASACQPNRFCPDIPLTRAEMAEFLIRGLYPADDFPFPATPYFSDVSALHPRFRFIQKLRELGITTGCSTTQFCPEAATNRGQMAVFVTRARLGVTNTTVPVNPAPYFTDVPTTHPFFTAIQKLRELGVTTGCSATAYCPSDAVTKAQMAVFTVRALLAP